MAEGAFHRGNLAAAEKLVAIHSFGGTAVRKIATVLAFVLLLVLPSVVRAEDFQPSSYEPVKVKVSGLSADRRGVRYQVTVDTTRAIRRVEQDVTLYTDDDYLGTATLTWHVSGGLTSGKTYDVVDHSALKRAVDKTTTLTAQRGVLRVYYADGTCWTAAGTAGVTTRRK